MLLASNLKKGSYYEKRYFGQTERIKAVRPSFLTNLENNEKNPPSLHRKPTLLLNQRLYSYP
jgi:hypothetical protein